MTDPKEILELLSKGADLRKAKSLRVIHDVCEEQRTRGSVDFSVATIGRLSSEKGGPAAGAIRNATGEAYRTLIKAHLDAAGGKKPKGKPHKADENPFEGITDPVLRARIGILLAENESLKGQLHAARNLSNTASSVDLRRTVPKGSSPANIKLISEQEWATLKAACDFEYLASIDLTVDSTGRVKNQNGAVIFKPGFISGLNKLIENLNP